MYYYCCVHQTFLLSGHAPVQRLLRILRTGLSVAHADIQYGEHEQERNSGRGMVWRVFCPMRLITRMSRDMLSESLPVSPLTTSGISRRVSQTKSQLFEILRSLEAVPGVPIETGASEIKTPAPLGLPDEDEEMTDAGKRSIKPPVYSSMLDVHVTAAKGK